MYLNSALAYFNVRENRSLCSQKPASSRSKDALWKFSRDYHAAQESKTHDVRAVEGLLSRGTFAHQISYLFISSERKKEFSVKKQSTKHFSFKHSCLAGETRNPVLQSLSKVGISVLTHSKG